MHSLGIDYRLFAKSKFLGEKNVVCDYLGLYVTFIHSSLQEVERGIHTVTLPLSHHGTTSGGFWKHLHVTEGYCGKLGHTSGSCWEEVSRRNS